MASFWHSLKTTLRLMAHNKVGFIGFLVVIFFILMSFVGPLFIPLDRTTKVDQIYAPTSLAASAGHRFLGARRPVPRDSRRP